MKASTRQHGLPTNPRHTRVPDREEVNEYWSSAHSKGAKTDPFSTKSELWSSGEFWNVDSNIRKWTLHEVRRNAAAANYATHAPDQVSRTMLVRHEDDRKTERQPISTSGMLAGDEFYLGPAGFELGARDRAGLPVDPPWGRVGRGQMFRGPRSFDRNISRLADYKRSLMLPGAVNPIRSHSEGTLASSSQPGQTLLDPFVAEDVLGESISKHTSPEQIGSMFDSRSCRYWDNWGHATKREAARLAYSVMSPQVTEHRDGHPVGECGEIRPAFVYTKKYKKARAGTLGSQDSLMGSSGSRSVAKSKEL